MGAASTPREGIMRFRGLAAVAGVLTFVACAPQAFAATGVGLAPGQDQAGRGSGPTADSGPSAPRTLAKPKAPGGEAGPAGIGDPYFPLEGNGGFDVRHYDLTFSYDPATDRLDAVNKIHAVATQALSRFDLDLQQL